MKFVVGDTVKDNTNNDPIPTDLRNVPLPPAKSTVDRSYKFERSNGEWQVNGVTWADVEDRVIAKPERGSVERWELINSAGGWSHVSFTFHLLARTSLICHHSQSTFISSTSRL
jgi:bilirubin oxidase